MFVGGLRIQYREKVKTFRHVIEIHRDDFGSKKTYWEETLQVSQDFRVQTPCTDVTRKHCHSRILELLVK